jgi:hypothetical protein
MKDYQLEAFALLIIGAAMALTARWALIQKPEYTLELIDQNTVEVTNEFGKTYICHPDSIMSIIDYDNK